ncbi:MAG: TIGR00730 family Rossman fold protein [Candidatus Ornithospirochaeta sp.]|nr:TIGR00730 family Rossman fold protein [Candidatus Ornithospirochaeta sp.]
MGRITSIAVFCGSSYGSCEEYRKKAEELGRALAERGITLVYGGGCKGLMGAVAAECRKCGGTVIGVLPKAMDKPSVRIEDIETKLIITEDMHSRKKTMYDLADAFIALPGGLGTFDEIFEILAWKQLKIHRKRAALLNARGFWDHAAALMDNAVKEGFLNPKARESIIIDDDIERILSALGEDEEELPDKI